MAEASGRNTRHTGKTQVATFGGAQRIALTVLDWFGGPDPAALPSSMVALRLSREAVLAASPAARALFGQAAERGAAPALLRGRISAHDPEAAAALDALLARGATLRRRVALGEAGVFDLTAEPSGGDCLLVFNDVTEQARALAAARSEAAAARAEAAALRAALETAPAPVWRRGPDGDVVWANAAARALAVADLPEEALRHPIAGASASEAITVGVAPPAATATEAALERFVATVTETFSHLRVGLAIYDRDRRLTLANRAVSELFGVDPAWIAARPTLRETLDRLREARQLPEQANYPAWRAQLFTLFDDVSRASYEERWELPDGRSIDVIGRPHAPGGIAFIFDDVTETIAMQRWRSTAVEVRRATLDALADGVVVLGPDGQTRMANPAFTALWRLGERFDDGPRHVSDIAAACAGLIGADPLWERIRAAVSGGAGRAPWSGRVRLSNGRTLMARIAPMPDGSTLAVFSDVTDSERIAQTLRERAEMLESATDMRNALLDQISHRLRTPLNAIMGFTELLLGDRAGPVPQAQRRYLDNIREAADGLLEGVESLADLVSTGSRAAGLQVGAVSLPAVLRGAMGLLQRRLAERGIVVELRAVAEDAAAQGDPARIWQLIFNMLAHAVSSAQPGAALTVGAARRGEGVEIWCDGAGLIDDGEHSPRLQLARRAAELQGGRVQTILSGDDMGRLACWLPDAPLDIQPAGDGLHA